MALEPAGVSLQAEGFKQYIKQLGEIEKKQRDAFEAEFKGTGKSFSQVQKAARDYERQLEQTRKAQERQVEAARKQAEENRKAAEAQKRAAEEAKQARRATVISGAATAGAAVLATATATVAAVGAAAIAVTDVANQTEQATNQIAASLGISQEAAKEYSDELQNIFVDNPQAQFEEIAEAIALTERALDGLTGDQLEDVANTALRIEQQFGQDLQKTVGATEQLIEQFGLSSQQATDLLTAGLQQIPAEDLIDTVGEYSSLFAQAGFSADEFFSILQTGVAGGVLGTDRIADATKEFQIRFLEGNQSLVDSFSTLGLNFDQLTQQVSAGQLTIADVFGQVVQRAGEVDLSVAENRAAIAGLGTQFEDLGATAIAALDPDAIGFEDVVGAADTLNARFDNIGDAFTSLQRSVLVALAPIGESILEVANNIIPQIKQAFDTARPGIEAFAQAAGPLIEAFIQRLVPVFQVTQDALARIGESLGLTSRNVDGASNAINVFSGILDGIVTVAQAVAIAFEGLARAIETGRQVFALARAGFAAFGSIISQVVQNAVANVSDLIGIIQDLITFDFSGAAEGIATFGDETKTFSEILDQAGTDAIGAFEDAITREPIEPIEIPVEVEPTENITQGIKSVTQAFEAQPPAIQTSIQNLDAYQGAIEQAEDLQRSFAREAEDTAVKIARANEDVARKQAQDVEKLRQDQAKDRDNLLRDQSRELDKFEADRRKQITKAEKDIQKARERANEERKQAEQKLQRELQQARDRFNLSRLQSDRRFALQEKRLIAEGDILALQQLREDKELERQEEKESFDQSQKERVQSAEETQRGQAKELEGRLEELKSSLEQERAELLQSFDQELADQRRAQEEATTLQQQKFVEDAQERQIALQREEEDRRLSQQRQLEDLGRSLADQQMVTAEGTQLVADEIEKVFGAEGVADSIFAGFKERTESDFRDLFENIQEAASNIDVDIEPSPVNVPDITPATATGGGGFGGRIGSIPQFQEGGIVPGPIGSPQLVMAHGGERITPVQQSMTMAAPVIPSQSLDVIMSGGFSITGDGQANDAILQAAAREMTDNFRIAVQRLARRN